MPTLLISVRFQEGRYHGNSEWPPSPARLFQALVAGAARGEELSEHAVEAFYWLEGLNAPTIRAPSAHVGQRFKNFVPNNDLDAVGGDPLRVNDIRVSKIVRPRTFDVAVPLVYVWTFEHGADNECHAHTMCEIADDLYQLGRGVDMAWAQGEVVDDSEADTRLRELAGLLWRPNNSGDGAALSIPHPGSLASLAKRFNAKCERFRTVGDGKKARLLFSQAPKPDFWQVPYNSPATFLLFDIKRADVFASQPLERVVGLAEKIRNLAVERLRKSNWRRDDPKRHDCIEKIFVGRAAKDADKLRRIRITPLPSIGHAQTERSVRRVLVGVPPECPIAIGDVAWAFSGLALDVEPDTGEMPDDGAELVLADDRKMLAHYGIEDAAPARVWRTVTPASLSEGNRRQRGHPRQTRTGAKGGAERLRVQAAAEWAVRQALRHTGVDVSVQAIRVQREPLEANGQRAEAFAASPRLAKERLWHVEIAFTRPVSGPLLVGDGRYLGLGLMRPVRNVEGVFVLAITDGLPNQAEPLGLTRALRRAVMARAQEKMGERVPLPSFFTGHATDGAPARSGRDQHLAFAFDAPRKRLIIIAPHVLARREALPTERRWLHILEGAVEGFCKLRAGAAGMLSLLPYHLDIEHDPLFARSSTWENLTPYCVTRHVKLSHAAAALEADLLSECRRAGFPRPHIEITKSFAKPGAGLFGLARLRFRGAAAGPILLGRNRHFGGGLFVATK